jgi:hypothetical protein
MPNMKAVEEMRKEMRKKGAFTKYCSNCKKTFGSDDMKKFLKMMEEHKCNRTGG